MKYLISKSQYNFLLEQTSYEKGIMDRSTSMLNKMSNLDPHTLADFLSIVTVFIPVVGPAISAGISLGDAALYYNEGDKKTATMTALFSFLPFGKIGKLIPNIKRLGKEGMENLAKKIGKEGGKGLTQIEKEVADGLIKNKEILNQEMKRISDDLLKKSKQTISELPLGNLGKDFKEYARTYKGQGKLKGWDWIQPLSTVGNSSGWKFHIFAADLHDVAYLYEKLLPVVQKYGAGFKVASNSTLASLSKGGAQFGKGAVIYIPSNVIKKGNLNNFVSEIKSAISAYKEKGNIFGDRMIDDRIGYRYEFNIPVNPSKGLPSSKQTYRGNDGNYNIPGNPDLFR